jgi:hypothetical protein
MPKHIEPELGLASFSCPHCGAIAHQSWHRVCILDQKKNEPVAVILFENIPDVDFKRIDDEEERKRLIRLVERLQKNMVTYRAVKYGLSSNFEMMNVHLSSCFSCDGFAVWVLGRLIYPERPSEITAHEEMPGPIKEDFEEAAAIVERSPRGAAALLRLCIQRLMPLLGEKGENLNEDIASLVRKGLEIEVQQALDIVRVIGNNSVHPGAIDIKDNKSTAIKLFELLNIIVERRIATPKRIAGLFGGLPPTALEQIEKRDGSKAEDK